jgi:hypothetical protein
MHDDQHGKELLLLLSLSLREPWQDAAASPLLSRALFRLTTFAVSFPPWLREEVADKQQRGN